MRVFALRLNKPSFGCDKNQRAAFEPSYALTGETQCYGHQPSSNKNFLDSQVIGEARESK